MLKTTSELAKEKHVDLLPFVWHTWPHNEASLKEVVVANPQVDMVIEVGGWTGSGSTLIFAEAMRNKPNGQVITVDTFNIGIWAHELQAYCKEKGFKDGKVDQLNLFLSNVISQGFGDVVFPFHGKSSVFFEWARQNKDYFKDRNILCYVDGDHSYEGALFDIQHFLALFPTCFLCGDDYSPVWPGVIRAVDEIAGQYKKELVLKPKSLWILQ